MTRPSAFAAVGVGVVVAGAAIVLSISHASGPSSDAEGPSGRGTTSVVPKSTLSPAQSLPQGLTDFPDRSEAGARVAAVRFLELTEQVVRLEPAVGAAVQRSISTDRSAARLADEVEEQLTTIRRVVPDGVVAYVAPVAVRSAERGDEWDVSIWYVEAIVYGEQLAVERWRTATYHLVWEHDSWRVDDLDSIDGPVPARPSSLVATPPAALRAALAGFDDEGLVP